MIKQETAGFIAFDNKKPGLLFDDSANKNYPLRYYNAINHLPFEASPSCSYYGYIYQGKGVLDSKGFTSKNIANGDYFSVKGQFKLLKDSADDLKVVIVEVLHEKGVYPKTNFFAQNLVGGPVEVKGRLKYIDGCTDSLLINPIKMGDPCLNHLHFPSNISQTPHTHPSHRIGIVARGKGECVTPFGNLPLIKGMIFVIKEWDGKTYKEGLDGKEYEEGTHCFFTKEQGMDVIAFHPDSDFGATDINHPMINRTIVKGVSANTLESIRTK